MKKLTLLACMLGLLATVSCKDDDAAAPANQLSINGKNFTAKNGVIADYGAGTTHYNYDFYITDGTLSWTNDDLSNATFMVYSELFSPGTTAFKTGTFQYKDSEIAGANDYWFDSLDVLVDTNGDGVANDLDDAFYATAGTVTVSGSGTNYTLKFDVTLDNGKKVTGSYSGNFQIIDQTDGERAPGEGARKAAKKLLAQ